MLRGNFYSDVTRYFIGSYCGTSSREMIHRSRILHIDGRSIRYDGRNRILYDGI